MLRRALQRLVRLSPKAARTAWEAVPASVRRVLGPLTHPIAAGPRQGSRPLLVERPERAARFDVVVPAGVTIGRLRREELEESGHRVLGLGAGPPEGLARAERVLDAVVLTEDHEVGAFQRLGWRVARDAGELDASFPEVTVVIPTHAARELCRSCLYSVIRSTGWGRLSVVVVDDCSSDGTAEMLREVSVLDARISSVRLDERGGFAAACNAGLARAGGDFVVLLNDDTVVGPGWLSRLVAHLEREPKLGLVCPVTNQISNEARVDVRYDTLEQMEELAVGRAIDHAGQLTDVRMIALFCAAARLDVLRGLGGLDERYELGMFEDDDLSLALDRGGLGLGVARDAFVHHVGQATLSQLDDAAYLGIWEANKKRFEEKWGVRWRPPAG